MTEADIPPPERPKKGRQEGEQEHLREDAGLARRPQAGDDRSGHLREDMGGAGEQAQDDKGFIEKIKYKLTGR